jgi:hypothetical protein
VRYLAQLIIFTFLFSLPKFTLAKLAPVIEITGFAKKDESGKDYLYIDTGSKLYTLKFRSVFIDNQSVLKRKQLPIAQVTLRVKTKDIIKVKKIKDKTEGYR